VAWLWHDRQLLHLHQSFPWTSTGANLTTSCLWKTTKFLLETGRMPRGKTLFTQVGGATDNVNQGVLRFTSWLCQQGTCKTVRATWCFLQRSERSLC